MLGKYADILDDRHLRRLIASQLLSRSPAGMMTIGMTVFVAEIYNSISVAGAMIACYSVGAAVAVPVSSRIATRFDARFVLTAMGLLWSANLVAIAVADQLPVPALLVLGTTLGLLLPPLPAVVRGLYSRIAPPERFGRLIALDTSLAETMWVFGPVVVAMAQHFLSQRSALAVIALISLAGIALLVTNPLMRRQVDPASENGGLVKVLAVRRLWPLLISAAGMMAGWGALEIALIDRIDSSMRIGILFALMSLSGAAGGILFGGTAVGPWSIARRACVLLIGVGLAIPDMGYGSSLVILTVAGCGSAITLAAIFTQVARTVGPQQATTAYGWVFTAQLTGTSLGALVSGLAIEEFSSSAAGIIAAVAAFAVAVSSGCLYGWFVIRRRE